MILINVKFKVRPEYVETFRDEAAEFTNATRAEPGCLFYEWYRSTDRPDEYVLVEGFQDDAAEAHVNSEHFKKATELFPVRRSGTKWRSLRSTNAAAQGCHRGRGGAAPATPDVLPW